MDMQLLFYLQTNRAEFKGDLQTIFRFPYLKVYKLITMGMMFKNL